MVQRGDAAMSDPRVLSSTLVGRVVNRIRRVRYVFQEQVTSDGGQLELTFDDAGALLCDAGPNGQELVLTAAEWVDPFVPPLSPESLDYVNRYGRWVAFDVSAEKGFRALVGTPVSHVAEVRSERNELVGLEVTFPRAMLRVVADSNESFVEVVGE